MAVPGVNIIGSDNSVIGANGVIVGGVAGTGASYSVTYPDQEALTANITTASTTLVVAGVAGQNIYLFCAASDSTGTNSGAYATWAYGPNSSSLTTMFAGQLAGISTTSGNFNAAYGSTTTFVQVVGPAPIPRVLPAGMNLYIVTTGTTISVKGYALYAQH